MNWSDRRYQARKPEQKREGFGLVSGFVGLITNLLLAAMKLMIGVLSGSVSIMADALNSVTDTFSSILTLVGFKISAKNPDPGHPYGHQRFEYISGLFISILLLFVGLQFLQSSYEKIRQPQAVHISAVVLIVLVLSIIVKLWQNFFYLRIGNHIQSDTLKATAKDSFMDVLTTSAILLSAFVNQLWDWNIDGWVGLFVALYIGYSGFMMLRGFTNELMGNRPSPAEVEEMTAELEKYHMILGFHDLLIHSYGPNAIFATVDIEIDSRWTLDRAHEVIDQIERDFKRDLNVTLVCHMDPIDLDNQHYNQIHKAIKYIIRGYDLGMHTHDFHVEQLPNNQGELVQFDVVVPEKLDISDEALDRQINMDLKKHFPDIETQINFDHNYIGEDKGPMNA
nr:cation diffusion facilitator family transporter [Agrilactobacillus fermenti]